MGLQYKPILKGKITKENIEWRFDNKCGSLSILNSVGTPAKCTHPNNKRNCCVED